MNTNTYFVDIASVLPDDITYLLGELTILFGRLEHMVLLATKRKRSIPLAQAQKLYEGYSIGAKLFGKQACLNAEKDCQNYESQPGLKSFSGEVTGLSEICSRIQNLTAERNRIMHGLITVVAEHDRAAVIYKNKLYSLDKETLFSLKENVIGIIVELNQLIPVPGVSAECMSGGDLDLVYDVSAFSEDDPIVSNAADC